MKHNWEYKRLGDVCHVIGGSTPKTEVSEFWNGTLNWFTPAEISEKKYYASSERKITEEAVEATGLTILPPGTVLLTSRAPIGKVGIATDYCYCNQGFKNLICKDLLFNEYLYYTLIYFNDDIKDKGRGATFKEISKKVTESISIPVPPMETQEQIVAELDQINDLIAKNRELLSQLDALAQSLFYDTFGDPISNPKRWDVSKIQDLGKVITGSTPSTKIEEYYNSPDICFVKPGDIGDTITYISRTKDWITNLAFESCCRKLPIGTVVITCIGIIGKVGILKVEANCNQQINAIIPAKAINNLYLAFTLKEFAVIFTAAATGPVVKILNKSTFSNFSIPVPPLALQEDFASKVEAIEAQKSKVEAEIAELQTLLDARMDYWFN